MKCSIIDRSTLCFDHQSAYCWSKFVCAVDPGWPRLSAKCAGSVRAILQDPPTATLSRIIRWRGVARWSKEMVDPSIIEHFIHCDAYWKKKMEWHAINVAINGNLRDSLVIRVEADTNHKSARFFFTPFVIKCMISQTQCHQLAAYTTHVLRKKIPYPLPFKW